VTDVAILKKLGMLEIGVMRLIQLMDADFQSNNKLVGKKELANAKMSDEVADERHGSRKNRKAIVCYLNKTLVSDYLRLTRRAGCFQGMMPECVLTVSFIQLRFSSS